MSSLHSQGGPESQAGAVTWSQCGRRHALPRGLSWRPGPARACSGQHVTAWQHPRAAAVPKGPAQNNARSKALENREPSQEGPEETAVLLDHHAAGEGLVVCFDEESPLLPVQDVSLHEDHVLDACNLQGKGSRDVRAGREVAAGGVNPEGWPLSPSDPGTPGPCPAPAHQPEPGSPTFPPSPDFPDPGTPSWPWSSYSLSPASRPSSLLDTGGPQPRTPSGYQYTLTPTPERTPWSQVPRPPSPTTRPVPSSAGSLVLQDPLRAHLPQQPRGFHAQPAAPLHQVHCPVGAAGLA
eukprot:bmy_14657T0